MELSVFLVVLLAAFLHAVWNAFVKQTGDRLVFIAVLMAGGSLGALATLPFLALPALKAGLISFSPLCSTPVIPYS